MFVLGDSLFIYHFYKCDAWTSFIRKPIESFYLLGVNGILFLLSYWFLLREEGAGNASIGAFMTTRVGDVFFLLGIVAMDNNWICFLR